MLLGHIAVSFAGKKIAPKTCIGTSIIAATLIDLLQAILTVLGIEKSRYVPGITAVCPFELDISWSHSLTMASVLSVLAGGMYFLVTKYRRGAAWLMLAVLSHWVLDVIAHIPDIPLWPGGPKTGFGLWMSLFATIAVEGTLFAAGIFLYLTSTRAKGIWGHIAIWLSVALLICIYISLFTSPPPSSSDIQNYQYLFICLILPLFGYWMDWTRSAFPQQKIQGRLPQ